MNKLTQKTTDKNTPNKFYYVWNYLEWGGAQVLFFGLMKEAQKFGEVVAIMPADSNEQLFKFLDTLKVRYEFVDSHMDAKPALTIKRKLERHWNKFFDELSFIRYLNKLDLKNNVVHTEFAPWQSFIVLRWICSKTQVFVTIHNSLPPVPGWRYFQWRIKFWLLTRSKNFHIFTANKDTKESLRRLVPPDSFDKIKVIYANINPEEIEEALADKLNRAEICQKYNLPNDKFMVFCVGQFIDRKGRWIFLEAAKKLLEKNYEIAFVWISNSKPCAEDLKKAESYGLGENFTLITADQVGSEHIDLFKLMRLADVFALPSYLEGLPISIIEAMALGIPTISTNINAIPEAIKHLETGLLIEPGKSEALTNAVETLKSDPNLRKKLAENGRKYVFEKFNQKVVARIAVENYIAAFRRQK